jgi:hypothetical protein
LDLKRSDTGIMMFCGGGCLMEYLLLNIDYWKRGKMGEVEKDKKAWAMNWPAYKTMKLVDEYCAGHR